MNLQTKSLILLCEITGRHENGWLNDTLLK